MPRTPTPDGFAGLLARLAGKGPEPAAPEPPERPRRDTLLSGPPPAPPARFAGPDASVAGPPREEPSPLDELVRGAVQDILLAVHAVTGRRWAALHAQDAFHEGGHSEGEDEAPVRLDGLVRAAYARLAGGATADQSDLARGGRPGRKEAAAEAVRLMSGWEDAHHHHLFGQAIDAEAVLAALGRLGSLRPAPVAYFRRHDIPPAGSLFRAGARVLSGDALDLEAVTLPEAPTAAESEATYVRSTRRYQVPPTAGERAEGREWGGAGGAGG